MCCAKKIAKIILVIFNTLFLLLGLGCIVAAALVIVDRSVLTSVLTKVPTVGQTLTDALSYTSQLQTAAYILLAAGCLVFIIAFAGCVGTLKESKCLLAVYITFVLLILVIQLAAGIVGYLFKDQATTYMRSFLNDTISQKYEGLSIVNGSLSQSIEPYSAAWDVAMISLECCGNANYSDFTQYATQWSGTYSFSGQSLTGVRVPVSCCKVTSKTDMLADLTNFQNYFTNATTCLTTADSTYTNTQSCYDRILALINTYGMIIFGVGMGIVGVELLLVIFASCLIHAQNKQDVQPFY